MTGIISPTSGLSQDQTRMLSTLMEWTTEPPILKAMLQAQRADRDGLALLSHYLGASAYPRPAKPGETPQPVLQERTVAAIMLSFLIDSTVRNTIARYISIAHQVPYADAKKDLYDLRVDLVKEHHTSPEQIPLFIRQVDEEAPHLVLPSGVKLMLGDQPLPDWVAAYTDCDQDLNAEGEAFIRNLPPAYREVVERFPPGCLVRATRPCHVPAPGEVGVMHGITSAEDGSPVVMVAMSPEVGAPVGEVLPEWLECCGYLGKITPERVRYILERPARGSMGQYETCHACGKEFACGMIGSPFLTDSRTREPGAPLNQYGKAICEDCAKGLPRCRTHVTVYCHLAHLEPLHEDSCITAHERWKLQGLIKETE